MVEDTFHNKQARMLISVLTILFFPRMSSTIDFTIIYNAKSGNINATITPEKNNVCQNLNVLQRTNKERR